MYWPDCGGWELIDFHGAGTYVSKLDNEFPPLDLWFGSDTYSAQFYEILRYLNDGVCGLYIDVSLIGEGMV